MFLNHPYFGSNDLRIEDTWRIIPVIVSVATATTHGDCKFVPKTFLVESGPLPSMAYINGKNKWRVKS